MKYPFFSLLLSLYSTFIIATCCFFSLIDIGPVFLGFIYLGWSVLTLMAALWAYERAYYYTQGRRNPAQELSHRLISSMDRLKTYNLGFRGLKALNRVSALVMGMGLVYGLFVFAVLLHPPANDAYSALMAGIEGVFTQYAGGQEEDWRQGLQIHKFQNFAQNAGQIGLIGMVFWLGQFFLFSSESGRIALWASSLAFAVSILALSVHGAALMPSYALPIAPWHGYGWGAMAWLVPLGEVPQNLTPFQIRLYETGHIGVVLAYIPPFIILLALLRNLMERAMVRVMAGYGVAVLVILAYADLCMSADPGHAALNIAGFSVLGSCIVRDRVSMRRIYRIYN